MKYYKIPFNLAFSTFNDGKLHSFQIQSVHILNYIKYEQMNYAT